MARLLGGSSVDQCGLLYSLAFTESSGGFQFWALYEAWSLTDTIDLMIRRADPRPQKLARLATRLNLCEPDAIHLIRCTARREVPVGLARAFWIEAQDTTE